MVASHSEGGTIKKSWPAVLKGLGKVVMKWKSNAAGRDAADSLPVKPVGTGGQTSLWSIRIRRNTKLSENIHYFWIWAKHEGSIFLFICGSYRPFVFWVLPMCGWPLLGSVIVIWTQSSGLVAWTSYFLFLFLKLASKLSEFYKNEISGESCKRLLLSNPLVFSCGLFWACQRV